MNGFIKLHRQILEWEWYEDKNCRLVFIHCLLKANFKDKRWRGKEVKRGSFITSLGNLSDEVGISKQQLRTVLEKLGKTGEITAKGQGNNTLVVINKYNDYQCFTEEKSPENNDEQHAGNTLPTHNQHAGNTEVTTTEEGKKDKNNNTTSTEFTPTSLDPNGLTNQEIAEHLDAIYKTPADIARMVKLSLGHEISDEKATDLLESFLTKGLSEYYTHIKSKALILGKFQQWCKNGVEKFNKPQQKEPQKNDISITDHYKKYYPDKWQFLDKSGKLKEYEAKFLDLNFKYSNIAKSHKNPTITAAFIFEAVQTKLNRHLSGSNEERRIASLTKWIERDLSDYKRNKADVRDEFYQWTQNKDK